MASHNGSFSQILLSHQPLQQKTSKRKKKTRTDPFIQNLVRYDLDWLSTINKSNSENPYDPNSFLQNEILLKSIWKLQSA
nr:hypothetical protein CFP56_55682 [Quercus suber]